MKKIFTVEIEWDETDGQSVQTMGIDALQYSRHGATLEFSVGPLVAFNGTKEVEVTLLDGDKIVGRRRFEATRESFWEDGLDPHESDS